MIGRATQKLRKLRFAGNSREFRAYGVRTGCLVRSGLLALYQSRYEASLICKDEKWPPGHLHAESTTCVFSDRPERTIPTPATSNRPAIYRIINNLRMRSGPFYFFGQISANFRPLKCRAWSTLRRALLCVATSPTAPNL